MQACARTTVSLPSFTRAIAGFKSNRGWVHRVHFSKGGVSLVRPQKDSALRCASYQQDVSSSLFPRQDIGLRESEGTSRQVFANQTVYKAKAALAYRPILPVFKALENGALALSREGCIFLEFSNGMGSQKYDWQNKQVFALSVAEVGKLLTFEDGCDFYHDPNMGRSNQGKVNKRLTIRPGPDGKSYFFSLDVMNSIENVKEKIQIPLTREELAVMQVGFRFILPHLMGWNVIVDPSRAVIATGSEDGDYVQSEDYEKPRWE